MNLAALFSLLAVAAAIHAPNSERAVNFHENSYEPHDVIHRDVCIIGGGATGTYAAIRLHDSGKSVVVVERDTELGGHTKSYNVPGSDVMIDYGVHAYFDMDVVRQFFGRFDIPLVQGNIPSSPDYWADFRTGEYIPDFVFHAASLARYQVQLEKYPYLEWTSEVPEPVPEDLLMPFSEYAKKHDLEDVIPQLYFYTQGPCDVQELPTYYVFQSVSSHLLRAIETQMLITARHNNHEIYADALEELTDNVLLSSNVIGAQRLPGDLGVKLVVMTQHGTKLIKAKKLLITIPPTMSNMAPFDIDENEATLFSQFNSKSWYVALVANASLPRSGVVENAEPYLSSTFSTVSSINIITSTAVDGIHLVKYRAAHPIPDALVKADISATVARLGKPTFDGIQKTAEDIEFLAYQAHVPFGLTVSADAIKDGFYRKLNALQGARNTWYTGAPFVAPHAAVLWNFTESLLPAIMDGL